MTWMQTDSFQSPSYQVIPDFMPGKILDKKLDKKPGKIPALHVPFTVQVKQINEQLVHQSIPAACHKAVCQLIREPAIIYIN